MNRNEDWTTIWRRQNNTWKIIAWRCHNCLFVAKQYETVERHYEICLFVKHSTEDIKTMPIHKLTIAGKTYYRWGDRGKLYENRADAEKQAQAAYANKYREKGKTNK